MYSLRKEDAIQKMLNWNLYVYIYIYSILVSIEKQYETFVVLLLFAELNFNENKCQFS